MKKVLIVLCLLLLQAETNQLYGQNKRRAKAANDAARAVVVDERLAVVREAPDASAMPIVRLRRGRSLTVTASKLLSGVGYYKVAVSRKRTGWIQREAVAARGRKGDDERLARLIFASGGFDRIDRARIFLELFADSPRRPEILLDFGDKIEEFAAKLSRDSARRLSTREMEASDAPRATFFLNFQALDRFRKIGIVFVFDDRNARYHYDGTSWREVTRRFPGSPEALAAAQRLARLDEAGMLRSKPDAPG